VARVVRTLIVVIFVLAGIAAIVWAFTPQPLQVDFELIEKRPLKVTVDEDGKTRIKDRFIVSSPLGGTLQRVDLLPGDVVEAGRTVLAILEPTAPQFLDARTIAESKARAKSAEAAVDRAEVTIGTARLNVENTKKRFERANSIANAISTEELEQADTDFRLAEENYRAAVFAAKIAEYEVELARAALAQTTDTPTTETPTITVEADPQTQFKIVSPIDGVVLDVIQTSAKIVTPGERLLEIGDPIDLELEIDVLSKDAVLIRPGDIVEVGGWGGEKTLVARVRLVEPSAFTHISALGVEEQRVNVIADFAESVEERAGLGDNYRVEARIVVWEKNDIVVVPTSALFRNDKKWAVFVVVDGQAKLAQVELGQRNANYAEVLDGIDEGDTVIVHPSDKVTDGVKVAPRE
jgi:HlyD family secretion protein